MTLKRKPRLLLEYRGFRKMEREKRLELLRILLQAVKLQLAYLSGEDADAQLTAQDEEYWEGTP